jgi:hypothetical protein
MARQSYGSFALHTYSMRSICLQRVLIISYLLYRAIEQRAITPKLDKSYGSCALHFYSMRSIYLQSFMLVSLKVLKLCRGQSSKCKNERGAVTPKIGQELWFLYTAHLPNEIYLPTKFHVDTSCCFSYVPG